LVAAALVGFLHVGAVLAEADNAARAEELFRGGKEHLAAGDYAQACPLLADSYRLDPATGTLLALALCHEREGKLASALDEYRDVAVRSRAQSRPDREAAAREKIAALEGNISTLTIDAAPAAQVRALQVRINGALLEPERLGTPLPLDGGSALIEASAEGRQPWSTSLTLAASGDALTLAIPALEPLAPEVPFLWPGAASAAAGEAPVLVPKTAERSDRLPRRLSPAQWTGIGLLGAAGVGLSVGLGFTVRAIRKDNDSEAGCIDDACTAGARADRLAARTAGNAASIAIATGLGLGTAGLITYLVGRRPPAHAESARPTLAAAAWAAPRAAGAALSGRFR
jgi:hypothetical protein